MTGRHVESPATRPARAVMKRARSAHGRQREHQDASASRGRSGLLVLAERDARELLGVRARRTRAARTRGPLREVDKAAPSANGRSSLSWRDCDHGATDDERGGGAEERQCRDVPSEMRSSGRSLKAPELSLCVPPPQVVFARAEGDFVESERCAASAGPALLARALARSGAGALQRVGGLLARSKRQHQSLLGYRAGREALRPGRSY